MDKLIPGLVLAAIGALTWIAYKHPKGYERLYVPLSLVSVAIFSSVGAWDISGYYTFDVLKAFIPPEKIAEAKKTINELRILEWWMGIAYFLFITYLLLLLYLPYLLHEEKPPKEKDN